MMLPPEVQSSLERVSQYFFSWVFPFLMKTCYNTEGIFRIKREHFARISSRRLDHSGDVTYSSESDEPGPRVLELGVGPGANFRFYPDGCRLTLVDPNPYFGSLVLANSLNFPKVIIERSLIGRGEDLSEIDSGSLDAVVTTMVLCSCQDVAKTLSEIRRVLRPNGTYFFVEHVLGDSGSIHNYAQRWFHHIWYFLSAGCNIHQDIGSAISRGGFADVQMRRFVAPIRQPLRLFIGPHIVGTATK